MSIIVALICFVLSPFEQLCIKECTHHVTVLVLSAHRNGCSPLGTLPVDRPVEKSEGSNWIQKCLSSFQNDLIGPVPTGLCSLLSLRTKSKRSIE